MLCDVFIDIPIEIIPEYLSNCLYYSNSINSLITNEEEYKYVVLIDIGYLTCNSTVVEYKKVF